jgi:RecB family exonuclease
MCGRDPRHSRAGAGKHVKTTARAIECSPIGRERLASALAWLAVRPRAEPLLVVAPSLDAGNALLREVAIELGPTFGWYRESVASLAARLAALPLARAAHAPLGGLGALALCARAVFELRAQDALGRFAALADQPGLARALAHTFGELGMAGVAEDAQALEPDLRRLFARYRELLARFGLADRAALFEHAVHAARHAEGAPLGAPVLFFDVPLATHAERELVAAVAARAPACFATVPALDARARAGFERALGVPARMAPASHGTAPALRGGASITAVSALVRLQRQLFAPAAERGALDDAVSVLSAPGEARECVEIARRILREAARGVRFDRMAILLRSPELYRVHVGEALQRARVPAWFSRGAIAPDPAGRALLALLACAAEGLSARRFAEYLSLGVVPRPEANGAPPAAPPRDERFVAPADDASVFGARALALAGVSAERDGDEEAGDAPHGGLPSPRHWERLLGDAAVIGGLERWQRRLDGLRAELELRRNVAADEARARAAERDIAALQALRAFALPVIAGLHALPERASWGEWIEALEALAGRAIDRRDSVLQGLAELAPMAPIGPIGLAEVRIVLERRFGEQVVGEAGPPAGKVFVASIDEARGMLFDVVFVPGLAEKMFPPRLSEDPLLLDAARARISPDLAVADDRIAAERSSLSLAVGAACERVVVSYPRFATDRARPRVPSFYGLEILRAAEGELPGFVTLVRRATAAAHARMGWPAPREARDAIDAAEYDLVALDRFLNGSDGEFEGAANYLLNVNPHLARALRFRARRWHRRWHAADGLVDPGARARAVLAKHALPARAYSASALEKFAACPYRFYLSAIVGLSPREPPEPLEQIDALRRGVLMHEMLRSFGVRMRAEGRWPLTAAGRAQVEQVLDAVIDAVAQRYHELLAPAIMRVWEDGIADLRADLREWLARAAQDPSWVPAFFELGFGMRPGEPTLDAASRAEPVVLDCGLTLRGAIDVIERSDDVLRAIDYKSGRARPAYRAIDGGRALQPVLYALALERLFPDARVAGGQAYYCTTRGEYRRIAIALDDGARGAAELLANTVGDALETGFLPAAPAQDACEHCDFGAVCGPYEEQRVARKQGRLERLTQLRRHA